MKYKSWFAAVLFTVMVGLIAMGAGYQKGLRERSATLSGEMDMETVFHMESSHNPIAVSSAGAKGIGQIMGSTWEECTRLMGVDWPFDRYWSDVEKNRAVAEYYMEHRIPKMLKAYDIPVTTETMLASYNGGIGRVKDAWRRGGPIAWKSYLPGETQEYIERYHEFTGAAGAVAARLRL